MKKLILLILAFAVVAFADIKLDFLISARRLGCETIQWVENDYENGIKCRLIINRFKRFEHNGKISNIDDMIDTCGACLLGVVPEDKNVSVYAGKPIVFGTAAKAIHRIAERLEGKIVFLPKIKDII